jgi:hypothetical protein
MMTLPATRGRRLVSLLIAGTALAACRATEEPRSAPQASPAAVATAPTTTTTTTTTMPPPPPVWRAARWGMTPGEVLAAFPEAQRAVPAASFGQPRPGAAEVAIPAYEADGTKVRVLFGFMSDRLNRIQLAAAPAGESTCEDLEKRLTGEHAAPSNRSEMAATMRTKEIIWMLPAQTIWLVCAEKPSLGYRTVTLDYVAAGGGATP